jgi:beta-glucosidase
MSMLKGTQGLGRAVVGVLTGVAACAPISIDLAHEAAGGATGNGGTTAGAAPGNAGTRTNTSETGGSETGGSSPGTTVGGAAGSAGRGPEGAGAPSNAGGETSGGSGPIDQAGQSTGGTNGGVAPSCGDGVLRDVRDGRDLLPGYTAPRDPRVATWLAEMSLDDEIIQMEGVPRRGDDADFTDIQRSQDDPLADGTVLRGFKYRAGSRGLSLGAGQPDRPNDGLDFATAFPAISVRAASWDLELEWQIGEAIGDEAVASKNNVLIGPSADLLRHPYWGGGQDAYGEDTYQVGRMGSAFVSGVQQHVAACAQNFLTRGVEKEQATGNAVVDEQSLREIYARPFEMLVRDGGVACVMTAYGNVNGVNVGEAPHLLSDVLKGAPDTGGFGFRGFVRSNWWSAPGGQDVPADSVGEQNAAALANAGLDAELPWTLNYRYLPTAVERGDVGSDVISGAAARVLEQKARFQSALTTDDFGPGGSSSSLLGASIATNVAHLALAERSELESAVLLANGSASGPVLPISSATTSIAVIGAAVEFSLSSTTVPESCPAGGRTCTFQFATDVALGDRATNAVNADPDQSVGPFSGIQTAAAAHGNVTVTQGDSAAAGAGADMLVVVVGLTPGDEGEEYSIPSGGDRATLSLPADQAQLVDDALSLMKPTVVVIESGAVVAAPWLKHANQRQATIWAGYGGMRSGVALGKLLFGDANFSGKLATSWPAESALPAFKDDETKATLPYFIGYRDYDQRRAAGERPDVVFPFGHGLSYTTFAYSDLALPCTEVSSAAVLDVTATVSNTGPVAGDEVAFLFVAGPQTGSEPRSLKELKSFARVSLGPGAAQSVHLPVRIQDLRHWSTTANRWVIDTGDYTVLIGSSEADADLQVAGTFNIGG